MPNPHQIAVETKREDNDLPDELVDYLKTPLEVCEMTEDEILAKTLKSDKATEAEYRKNLARLVDVRELIGKIHPSTKQ